MSLDIYLKTKEPIKKEGTGIFIRENGSTRELSLEEAQEMYPNATIEVFQKEDNVVWRGNITHNLCKMAENVLIGNYNLYEILWRSKENGFTNTTNQYKQLIYLGLYYALLHRRELEEFNPTNGWGSYNTFLEFLYEYSEALSKCDNLEIDVSA